MERILNLLPLTDEERSQFLAAAPDADQVFIPTDDLTVTSDTASLAQIARANIIFGNVPPHMLAGASGLRWLQTWSSGVDPYLTEGSLPEGVMLTSAVGAFGRSVSEHMLACLMAVMKRLPVYRADQLRHAWKDEGRVQSLEGARVLLLGTGDIGSRVALMLKGMGSYVIGFNRHPNREQPYCDEIHSLSQLDELLPTADVVVMALPENPETIKVLDAYRLGLLPSHAVIANAGRGSAIDQDALVTALRTGKLWGAALDVTTPEPLPADSPLWDCPNLLLTPHVAGAAHLHQTVRQIVAISLENLKHYMAGEPLRNRIL